MRNERLRITLEIALTIALAVVLSLLTLFHMPQGGGISLAMLPLFVLALRRGFFVGTTGGLLYGVLDAMINGYVVHPIQYVLDYPAAFALVGLAGLFAPIWRRAVKSGSMRSGVWAALLPGVVIGAAGRYAMHVVSGAVYFSEYMPEGQKAWILSTQYNLYVPRAWAYSVVYNLYVPVAAAACLAAIALIMPALSRAADYR
ncbi:MAG: energy-coupled thiamine transporter ThiT [Actinomycetota bacterium]|nr:energy-coupled thiamine transporter ThiT [Actinomycetota bacterium]